MPVSRPGSGARIPPAGWTKSELTQSERSALIETSGRGKPLARTPAFKWPSSKARSSKAGPCAVEKADVGQEQGVSAVALPPYRLPALLGKSLPSSSHTASGCPSRAGGCVGSVRNRCIPLADAAPSPALRRSPDCSKIMSAQVTGEFVKLLKSW